MQRTRSALICRALIGLLVIASVRVARADEGLSEVYAAILRGDTDAGRTELQQLRAHGAPEQDVARVEGWLDSYRNAVASRQETQLKTFEWNVERAKKALADGQVYFALAFATQAQPYAPDPDAYANEDWIKDLTKQVEARAKEAAAAQQWTRAHASYLMLARIHPKDKRFEDLRDDAARHGRIEVLYKDQAALDKRIKDVRKDLLSSAIKEINRNYFEEPDFKKMAEGALDNLVSLAETKKLYDFLHGLGNPETRKFFVRSVQGLRENVATEERYNYKDLLRLFNRVASVNAESAELPEGLLVVEFLEGAVQKLDAFTSVVWPADSVDFDKMMMGGFEGVGIQLGIDERTGRLKVVTPLEDSPALEAGIQPGDLIIDVDGKSTQGWSTDDAVSNIMGKAGTPVTLSMFRPGTGERLAIKLVRRKIVLRTVRGVSREADHPQEWNYMLDPAAKIAYVQLSGFHPDSHEELDKALQAAQSNGMRGLILDLRYDPGGLLDVAVRIVSTFLHSGEVVSTGGRNEPKASQRVTDEALVTDVPLIVLVNEGSASASEILAGALKDHNRAIILGERTYGKGSVQKVISLGDKARIKLTTSLYYLPSGRSPHRAPDAETWGVDPNWELKLTPKETRQVLKHQNESMVIHNEAKEQPTTSEAELDKELNSLKHDSTDKDEEPPLLTDQQIKELEADPIPAPDSDPQLATALLLLRVKLAGNLPWPARLVAKSGARGSEGTD